MGEFLTFTQYLEQNLCHSCQAPCCQIILIPTSVPATFMEIDHIRYRLNFSRLEMAVSKTGDWFILVHDTCGYFDKEAKMCAVHGSDKQPLTCKHYNPHHCWYWLNLESAEAPDIYILNRASFEYWVDWLKFNKNGEIVAAPNFKESQEILDEWKQRQGSSDSPPRPALQVAQPDGQRSWSDEEGDLPWKNKVHGGIHEKSVGPAQLNSDCRQEASAQ